MMTLECIRQALQDRRIEMVATATGLHYNTIRAIRDNQQANPEYRTIQTLSDYLERTTPPPDTTPSDTTAI